MGSEVPWQEHAKMQVGSRWCLGDEEHSNKVQVEAAAVEVHNLVRIQEAEELHCKVGV